MDIRFFRIGILAATVLLTALVGILFFLAPVLGSAFLMAVQSSGDQLPRLTASFALPMLRATVPGSLDTAITAWWADLVWLFCFALPWLILAWSRKGPDLETCTARWLIGMSIYLPVLGGLLAAIFAGLVISLAPL